jgi:hypothetical protein
MKVNWDKVKHTAGVVALSGIVPAATVPHYGPWFALALGAVAFFCGVQSEKMFETQVVDTLAARKEGGS